MKELVRMNMPEDILRNIDPEDPDDMDFLLEIADLTRQLITGRKYEDINALINCTIRNGYNEAFSWIMELLQEEFGKKEDHDLAGFSCDIGRSVANFDEFAERLQIDFHVLEHDVEKVLDEHGEEQSFFNNFTYRTRYDNIFLISSENFDPKDNDYIQYRLVVRR